jgi:hypothetical protein
MIHRRAPFALAVLAALAATGCGSGTAVPTPTASAPPTSWISTAGPSVAASAQPAAPGYTMVLLIAEENKGYSEIIGAASAPYLNELAQTYGLATRFDAGYPPKCPSLAAYILLTSGTTAGICDDRPPAAHRLTGDNIFQQVTASGQQWRNYADSAPGPCALEDSRDSRYAVRHVPATYYLNQRTQCEQWTVPLGEPTAGALQQDITAGALPAYGFVSPDSCHDMHGAPPCPRDLVGTGDRWLHDWLPRVLAGPDYRAGRLAIIVTWDEGTATDNHIATLVVTPTTGHVASGTAYTHCSILRTVEDLLRLPALGCAAGAPSMRGAFHL